MAKRKKKVRQTRGVELLDGRIHMSVPGSYRRLTAEELAKLVSGAKGDVQGFRDTQGNTTLVAEAQRLGFLASKVGRPQLVCQNSERGMARSLAANGYELEGFFEKEVAGEQATGFLYHYVGDVAFFGEMVSVRSGKILLTLTVADARAKERRTLQAFDAVLASIAFGE